MSDEQFRLTPLDVRRWEFGSALRGYDRARVDEFKTRVADELEDLTRRVNDLDAKARGFHEQIRSFRERDRAINDALVSAQQLRTDIREQAEKEGALVLQEARGEAEKVLGEARLEADRVANDARARADELLRSAREEADSILRRARNEASTAVEGSRSTARRIASDLDQLHRARTTYLTQLKSLAERHLQEVEAVRASAAPIAPLVDAYLSESEEVVDKKIRARPTPLMNTVIPAKETITDPAMIRAVQDGIIPGDVLPEART